MTEATSKSTRPRAGRQALIWIVKLAVSGGLLYLLLARVDMARLWDLARTA
jgi:hypothetical protein